MRSIRGKLKRGWLASYLRFFRWILETPLAAWLANRLIRKAKRLERAGRISDAYEETLRALGFMWMRCWSYWNPVLLPKRIHATMDLDRLALAMGRPPPREEIQEILSALGALREVGGSSVDDVFAEEVQYLERRLRSEPIGPHQQ